MENGKLKKVSMIVGLIIGGTAVVTLIAQEVSFRSTMKESYSDQLLLKAQQAQLKTRVENLETTVNVELAGNWCLLQEILKKLDPAGAEERIKYAETRKQVLSRKLEKRRENEDGG